MQEAGSSKIPVTIYRTTCIHIQHDRKQMTEKFSLCLINYQSMMLCS